MLTCWLLFLATAAGVGAEVIFPRVLLKTPFEMEAQFGRPSDVLGDSHAQGVPRVVWKYINRVGSHGDREVGNLYLRLEYANGKLVSAYAAPGSGEKLPSSPRAYIPSDVAFSVRAYDDEGKLAGTADRPYVELVFSNRYVEGSICMRTAPMEVQQLQPSGMYKTTYDFSKVWEGETLSAELKLRGPYLKEMRSRGSLAEDVVRAIAQLPLKTR
ncbi:MAG: hypothetical protein HY319_13175 [Armatimonadetes bacterium]|nr:hypothetical protein [Armatimonadota bacterium]